MTLIPWLRPADFYRENNGDILRAARALFSRGDPIDNVSLAAELDRMGILVRVGGRAHLALLQESVPTAANMAFYALRVRDLSQKRLAIEKGREIVAAGLDPMLTAAETIAVAQRGAFELADFSIDNEPEAMSDLLGAFVRRLEEARSSGIKGLATGFFDLDRLLRGLRPGDLVVVAGRPSMGKSALGVQIAFQVAKTVGPVAVFSLEMSKEQLVDRIVASESRIDKERLDRGTLSDVEEERLIATLGPLGEVPIYIDDSRGLDELTLSAKVRNLALSREVQERGGLKLVVVDYLSLLKSSRDFRGDKVQEVGHFSQSLKALAGDMHIPLIVMSQLNREPDKRPDHRPMLSDLRDSGSVEQDADIVIFLLRQDYYERDPAKHTKQCEVIVAKHRNGSTGEVRLRFEKGQTRFDNLYVQEAAA